MSCILIFLTLLIQCLLFCFEGKVFQSGESKITKSGTFIILYIIHSKKTEFTFETNQLLGNATVTQEVFYESNESS